MSSAAPPDLLRAWKPAVPGIREVLHARFRDHAYPPHSHDTWNVFLVDDGQIRYDLDGHHRGARRRWSASSRRTSFTTGGLRRVAATASAWLYLEMSLLGENLIGYAVDQPFIEDARLRQRLDALHRSLEHPDDALEAETHLVLVAERLRTHLEGQIAKDEPGRANELAERLRDLLEAHVLDGVTLAAAGEHLGASPAHLVRCFSGTFGIAPHAYVLGRRIDAARERLLGGEPIAQVAASVGFYDQSHLTRHFKRHVGTTPGRYGSPRRSNLAASSSREAMSSFR
jgi:AraC-like DNA-binding protein